MFIRFREVTANRYGDGERACTGKCKDRLEAGWAGHAEAKARESSIWNEQAKADRRAATEAEATLLQVKRLRGNPEAFDALNMLLGVTLSAAAMGKTIDYDEIKRRLKQQAADTGDDRR
jgi:hypothetical protein